MSYTSIRNFGFIFTSLILGTLVAGRFPSSNGSEESTSSVVMPGQFVQEPTERTSRRPNFSNEEFLRSKKQSNNRSGRQRFSCTCCHFKKEKVFAFGNCFLQSFNRFELVVS